MEMSIQGITISWVFSVLYLLFCIYLPNPARIFAGVFYIIMGGINLVLVVLYPEAFVLIGSEPLLGLYRPIFEALVPKAPGAWGLLIALFEIAMGLMILQKGWVARLGLIGYTLFLRRAA